MCVNYGLGFPYIPEALFKLVEAELQKTYETAVWEHLNVPKCQQYLVRNSLTTQEFHRCCLWFHIHMDKVLLSRSEGDDIQHYVHRQHPVTEEWWDYPKPNYYL